VVRERDRFTRKLDSRLAAKGCEENFLHGAILTNGRLIHLIFNQHSSVVNKQSIAFRHVYIIKDVVALRRISRPTRWLFTF
jgi:hypothetical protein